MLGGLPSSFGLDCELPEVLIRISMKPAWKARRPAERPWMVVVIYDNNLVRTARMPVIPGQSHSAPETLRVPILTSPTETRHPIHTS